MMPNWTNNDLFNACSLHHAKFHIDESDDERTSYDIRAERKILIAPPIKSVQLKFESR